jgi:hypothetical protein
VLLISAVHRGRNNSYARTAQPITRMRSHFSAWICDAYRRIARAWCSACPSTGPAKRVTYCRVVNAARLAVAPQWIALLLLGTQSTTLQAYNSTSGVVLLAVGAAVCLSAYRIMLRIGKLPQERRVLR